MGFLASLIWYTFLAVFLAAVAVAGVFVGKKLRDKKSAGSEAATTAEKNQ